MDRERATAPFLHAAGRAGLHVVARLKTNLPELWQQVEKRFGPIAICHHQAHSILMAWLLTLLALVIERLYRIRHLHRGLHPVRTAEELCRLLWLSLSRPLPPDSS